MSNQLVLILIFLTATSTLLFAAGEPHYIFKHERAVLVKFNSSLVKDEYEFSFKKINKTTTALNVSFTLLEEMMDEDIMIHTFAEKRTAQGDYRFCGIDLKTNGCKFFKTNAFGWAKSLTKYGNITACNLKKGYYYVRNYIPDTAMLPKYLFFGNFRLSISAYHHDVNLFLLHWFVSIEKPPVNW